MLDVALGAIAWERREEAACMDNMVTTAAFSRDGSVLAVGCSCCDCALW